MFLSKSVAERRQSSNGWVAARTLDGDLDLHRRVGFPHGRAGDRRVGAQTRS